jgi:hypothetical protein
MAALDSGDVINIVRTLTHIGMLGVATVPSSLSSFSAANLRPPV